MKGIVLRITALFIIYLFISMIIYYTDKEIDIADETQDITVVDEDEAEDQVIVEDGVIVEDEVVESVYEEIIAINADNASSYGISGNTSFTLLSTIKLNKEEIKAGLLIEPIIDYDIEVLSDIEFKIIPQNYLSKNTIYRFSYDELDYGKAFQTVEELKVIESYPGSDSQQVPLGSSIEIKFNGKKIEGFEEHFSIEPEVKGSFSYEDGKHIFLSEGFEANKEYKVKISAGVSDDERVLEDSYEFKFNTGLSYDFNQRETYTMLNSIYGETPFVQLNRQRKDNYNIEILQSSNFNVFKDTYEYYQNNKSHDLSFDNYEVVFEEKQDSFKVGNRYYLEVPDNLEKGYYIIRISGNAYRKYVFLHVGEHHIYYSKATNGEMIWLINGQTSQPVVGKVYSDEKYIGKTNKEGILQFESDGDYTIDVGGFKYIVKALSDDPYYAYYGSYVSNSEHWSFIYTDRSNYKNDDTINIFAFVKSYSNMPIKNLKLELGTYWTEDVFLEKDVKLSSNNTITTSLDIKNFDDGYYSIRLIADGIEIDKKFIVVNSYEKPEVKLNLSSNKEILFSGDPLRVKFSSNYYNEIPYKDFNAKVTYGSWYGEKLHKYIETGEDNEFEFEITPIIRESDWHPVNYQIKAENNQIEDTRVETYDVVTVMPRDIMIQVNAIENEDSITLNIDTSNIDITSFAGSFGRNYENIKGGYIDRDLKITVTEKYYEKTFIETVYDKIHKVSRDRYSFKYKTNHLGDFEVNTKNGLAEFDFDIHDDSSYEFIISTNDKEGRLTREIYYHNSSLRNYFDDFRYSFNDTNSSYTIGDNVKTKILSYDEEIEDNDNDIALLLIKRNGILDYIVTDKTDVDFEFLEDYRPNVLLSGIYFDGLNMNYLPGYGNKVISYKNEELELDIEVTSDKLDYLPGEEVVLNIYATDKEGIKINGEANISVVDEAYFSLYEDYFKIKNSLHQNTYYDGVMIQTITSPYSVLMGGAEGGEGGDGSFIRDEFKDTAIFTTININNGKGSLKFNLPDDLTKWRITTHIVNSDLNYGVNKSNINTKLPFFIRTLYDTSYLVGDDIYVNLKSDGYDIADDSEIKYSVVFGDEINEETTSGKDIVNIPIGKLNVGEYELTVIADHSSVKDGVREDIEVTDTYIEFDHKKTSRITEKYQSMNIGNLSFYNKEARDLELEIANSFRTNDFRLEEMIARFGAYELLNKYFGSEHDTFGIKEYQDWNGSIKELLTANGSLHLTALIAGTGYGMKHFDEEKVISYLRESLLEKNTPVSLKAMILWGLAKQEEPVLLAINQFLGKYEFDKLDSDAKIYIMNALLDIGEYSRVKELYDTAFTREDILTYREYLLTVTINNRLGYENYNIVKSTVEAQDKYDTYNLEKIYNLHFYESDIENTFVTYKESGKINSIELRDTYSRDIKITENDFEIIEFYGEVYVTERYKVTGNEYDKYNSHVLSVEKLYLSDDIRQGDVVEVVVKTRKIAKECAVIHDRIPAGFIYAGMIKHARVSGVEEDKDLKFYIHGKETGTSFTYYIMATQVGKYNTERAAIQNYYREELEFSDKTILEVNPID